MRRPTRLRIESVMGSARLFQTTGVEEQWRTVISPWLAQQAEGAGMEPMPTVILTPSRAESFYLRSRLVAEGRSFLGFRFWTPSDLRSFLMEEIAPELQGATEAELRLVARAAAEKVARKDREASLASVQRDPSLFLRAYDLLSGAGWDPAKDGATYSRKLAREFGRLLKDRKVATQAGLHRALWAQSGDEPRLRNLLVAGFDATHWPLWELLKAAVRAAGKATMCVTAPRAFADKVDQLWIGSWEEELGSGAEISETASGEIIAPFAEWVGAYERGALVKLPEVDFTFLAAPDLGLQIGAIVLQALTYLKGKNCGRLGIVFTDANALALGVVSKLQRLGVPLDDATGHFTPGPFEGRTWRTWLDLQDEPSAERLFEWVRAAEVEGMNSGSALAARDLIDVLESALGETLIDDLAFLGLHLEDDSERVRARLAAEFLRTRIQLPEEGTFAEFWEKTQEAIRQLDWGNRLELEWNSAPEWLHEADWILPRRTFLEWLRESSDSRERTRGAESNHFYGKVHLLLYAQMPGQTWTHLIMTGLNEGRWPRLSETGAFGSRYELMELNRQARALNRRSAAQGGQGAGHEAVRPEHGYCLLPLERYDLALRDMCAAVESTSRAVCFTAMTAEAGRTLLHSDFFASAFQAKTDCALDEEAALALAKTTSTWCDKNGPLLNEIEVRSSGLEIEGTYLAFAARRDADRSFGRFEFAYEQPPAEPIQLACKTWEKAWNFPASVWLEEIIGVSEWPDGQLAWPRAVGTWVHRWLASALKQCAARSDFREFLPLLRTEIDREPRRIHEQMARTGTPLYPWWNNVWGKARATALGLAESLAPHLPGCVILSEFKIPKDLRIALPGVYPKDFELRGKIDFLRIAPIAFSIEPASSDPADSPCWVIDFKTGAEKGLTNSRMEKGMGLQAMLYALAVRAMGAESVELSLHTVEAPLKPQVRVEQVEANTALFRSLDRMHRSGVFGMRPAPENDYGFSRSYPLATRMIPAVILEAKWALAHGAGALWEEA